MASSSIVARSRVQLRIGADVQPSDDSRPSAKAPSGNEAAHDDKADRGAWWYLVWCHERSCKEETKVLRDTLEKLVHDAGGKFFCVKKARAYNSWRLGVGRHAPHLLLTDWREIKPYTQTMASSDRSGALRNRPLRVVVLAEQQNTFQRAREWSRTVRAAGGDDTVDVIRSIDELRALLAKVLRELSFGFASWTGSRAAEQGSGSSDGDPGKGQEAAVARSAPFVFSVAARGLPPSVLGVLPPFCAWQSEAAVEEILRLASMDQLYED